MKKLSLFTILALCFCSCGKLFDDNYIFVSSGDWHIISFYTPVMGGAIPSGMQTTLHRMNGSVIQPVALPPDGRIIWRVPGGVDQVVWRTQAIISGYTYTNEMSLFRSLKKDYDTHMIDFTYTGLNVFAPIISIGEYKPDTDEFTYRTPLK